MDVTQSEYTEARTQLHTIAEWLLAGPQYATSGTIRLEGGDGAISTVADPAVSVDPAGLHHAGRTVPLRGSLADLAASAGLPCVRPSVEYHDQVPGGPGTTVTATRAGVAAVIAVFDVASEALDQFCDIPAVLWPEHFDMGARVAGVNYGVSPGDSDEWTPYAYVGPDVRGSQPFWNRPFGAALPLDPGDPRCVADVLRFFEQGRTVAADS